MAKFICMLMVAVTVLTACGTVASASWGSGVEVMAGDVSVIKTGLLGQKLSFTDSDIKSALCISSFKSITVTRLPLSSEGTLLLAGRRIKEGQTVKRKNVAAMVFVPASAQVSEASFGFTVEGAGTSSVIECSMRFIDKINYAPKAPEDNEAALTRTTQQTIGIYGRMEATDPEGDSLEFITVSYPKNGRLVVSDRETGVYKYTPDEGYTGYDKFVYVARDEYGNYSETVTVNIKVIERMTNEVFLDMTERAEYNAAVAMSAMGIMSASRVGDDLYFSPDEKITRAEFCAMALKACGIRPDTSAAKTFFDDDAEIPLSLKPYVSLAQRVGIIDGSFENGRLIYSPCEEISAYEAATVIARILGIDRSEEEEAFEELEDVPYWARGAVSACVTVGILDSRGENGALSVALTRATAAEYLYRAVNSMSPT